MDLGGDLGHLDVGSLERKRREHVGSGNYTRRIATTPPGPVVRGGKEANTN